MSSFQSRSVLLFGPQSTEVQADRLNCMREILSTCPSLQRLHDDLLHFQSFGERLEASDPDLESIGVAKSSSFFSDWIQGRNSGILEASEQHPNAIATPLSVLSQILIFFQHWTGHYSLDHRISVTQETTFGGLCVGQLAATAVRSSSDEKELARRASIAVRLAFCIGAYIDLDRHHSGDKNEARGLVVTCRDDSDDIQRIREVLGGFDTAYISVHQHAKITVTVGKVQAPILTRSLNAKGFQVRPINLFGRFHCSAMTGAVQKILELARGQLDLQLDTPDASRELLESILTLPQDWHSALPQMLANQDGTQTRFMYSIGENMVSPSLAKKLGLQVGVADVLSTTRIEDGSRPHDTKSATERNYSPSLPYPDDAVAVTGMACKFAGAENLEEFWRILETGTSMHRDLPKDRFPDARFHRRQFFRNFQAATLDDVDAFDHKFFRVSSREATYMDPQQRIGLQVLYQALESSGYFERNHSEPEHDIGLYMATCMNEYAENVSTHPPSAFSLTGSIRPFVSGKFSYHFGWTGPSIMYDTACAASGTAIHQACRAVASGECAGAVAGGTNIFVSPDTFQNLAAGHFTSPTGPSKTFDASADGYGRGEGVAFIVLKRLSDALRDGDPIRGVLSATGVGQNANEHSITVPHGPSQMSLYRKALKRAGVDPQEVSYVEAHGTGTPVGDPIEADSIRRVFGHPDRQHHETTYLGSHKSNIGHTEATSGLSALIKVLLMMQKGVIPQQALFNTLNPAIGPLEPDGIKIPTRNVPWTAEFKAACVNNYGASGTNAVMVVTQPPNQTSSLETRPSRSRATAPYPVSITASTPSSLAAYSSALLNFINQSANPDDELAMDVAYHLSRRKNLTLPYSVSATISSMRELKDLLASPANHSSGKEDQPRPVVLFFGGQTGKKASVPRAYYDSSAIFRKHLDDCDTTLRALGAPSIFPAIFEPVEHDDVVLLHSALFSGQYASARAWLDCGLEPARVVGHSFGQLTALCISGVLPLRDGLRLVTKRARLIRDHMSKDSGSMIAVEAGPDQVSGLLRQHGNQHLDIACYNASQSSVVAGSTSSVDAFEGFLKSTPESIRFKRLQVTHAYHSVLTDPLVRPLQDTVEQLSLHPPTIPLETCSQDKTWQPVTPALIASHTREPVYFHQAVERISEQLGSCTWLEAGSGSGAPLLKRALGAQASSHEIRSLTLDPASSLKPVADTTAELWKLGVGIRFWPFHHSQRDQYRVLNLPPYQFDVARFWLEWKELGAPVVEAPQLAPQPMALLQLSRKTKDGGEFHVNTQCESWQTMCSDHRILGVSVCPLSSLLDLISQAIESIQGSSKRTTGAYNLQQLATQSPIPAESEHGLTLTIANVNANGRQSWTFTITDALASSRAYASGTISAPSTGNDRSAGDFARFQRLLDLTTIKNLSNHAEADSIKGKAVYRSLANLFSIPTAGQEVKEVSAKGKEATGYLMSASKSPLAAIESALQVPLLCLNGLHDRQENEIHINTAVGSVYFRDSLDLSSDRQWVVHLNFSGLEGSEATCDMFVFDARSEQLSIILLDVSFSRVRTHALQQALNGAATTIAVPQPTAASDSGYSEDLDGAETRSLQTPDPETPNPEMSVDEGIPAQTTGLPDLSKALFDLLVRVADVEVDALRNDVSIADLGIDSLMGMEVAEEISKVFSINIDGNEIATVPDLGSLCQLIASRTTGFSYDSESGLSSSQSDVLDMDESGARSLSSATTDDEPPNDDKDFEMVSRSSSRPRSSNESFHAVLEAFDLIREEFDVFAKETGCDKFSSQVHPQQESLIVAYITEAFAKLGCDLASVKSGKVIPKVSHTSKNDKLVMQLMRALRDDGLIAQAGNDWIRTSKPVLAKPSSSERFDQILADYPQFAPEHKLLHAVGCKLDECLNGKTNPLTLLFGNREKRKLMADQYLIAPIQSSASQQLASFIRQCFGSWRRHQTLRVLEIGGGTCGTTIHAVEAFARLGIDVEYTFSDVSASFVMEAKSKLGQHKFVKYRTLDITEDPAPDLRDHFDMIFATNTVHATPNASHSARNARKMLRSGGFLALVEYTQRPYYFLDVIFGQLDGWWAFNDGREHALMDVDGWKATLNCAGFEQIDWTGSNTQESKVMRIILAY